MPATPARSEAGNCSIEIPLKPDQRQRMPLPEAHGWVGADIEDDVENELRVAAE